MFVFFFFFVRLRIFYFTYPFLFFYIFFLTWRRGFFGNEVGLGSGLDEDGLGLKTGNWK